MKLHYFNSTHWDREWYLPMQNFRYRLVATMERILDGLEDEKGFNKYTFDGQTIVLEDVCEIKPEDALRISNAVKAGKLNIGPWYVMPDEFLVSGESLIRNLLIGKEVSEEFGGKPWPIGYICDIFGHIAQMPQIFKGFNIDVAVLWRGMDKDWEPYFFWQAPDGSRTGVVKLLPYTGYGSFSLHVTGSYDLPLNEADFKARTEKFMQRLTKHYGDEIIMTDAIDHSEPHPDVASIRKWLEEMYPGSEFIHSDYTEFYDFFKQKADLPTRSGEFIITEKPEGTPMIPHTLSSRYDIKAGNDKIQNRYELMLDPLMAREFAGGRDFSAPFWKYAWKQFIKNHPHDSICGCSVDAVHRQMLARYEEIHQVGDSICDGMYDADWESVTGRNIRYFTNNLYDREQPGAKESNYAEDGCYTFRIFNALPFEEEKIVSLELPFPAIKPYPKQWQEPFGYQLLNAFRIYDNEGNEVPFKLTSVKRNQLKRFYYQDSRKYDVYSVTCRCKLAASGWTVLQVKPSDSAVRYFGSQLVNNNGAENALLKLTVEDDGSLTIFDKVRNRSYSKLNLFEVDRDIGDGWNMVHPVENRIYQKGVCTGVSVVEDGRERTVFAVDFAYQVAREMLHTATVNEVYSGIRESDEYVILKLRSFVTVDAGSDAVKIRTEVDNNVCDCRVKVRIPTGIAGNYYAAQAFTFIEREPGRASGNDTATWPESEPLEKNMANMAGKRDDKGGIAFIGRYGLHEVAASEGADGTLFVTLYRCFSHTVATNGEPDGQLQKHLTFEYALKLTGSDPDYPALTKFAQGYRTDLFTYMLPAALVKNTGGDAGFVTVDGDLSYSALKPAHDLSKKTVILRLVNLSGKPGKSPVKLAASAKITPVNLAEEVCGETVSGTEFTAEASPWQVVSYKLEF